jgi:glycosyltransferase involved in cell wall biosynthesis
MGLDRNALPEITQQGRFGFCIGDATAHGVADALLEAFRLPERLAQMGAEGQKACLENFTWENTVKRIIDGIDNCNAAPAGVGFRN